MRFYNIAATILLASAGFAAAKKCEAQNILDACLKTTESGVDKCSSNDWQCLCDEYTNVLTCYNNCPGDEGRSAVQSQVTANCNAAKSYGSSSSSASGSQSTQTPSSSNNNGGGGNDDDDDDKDDKDDKDGDTTGTSTASAAAETATGAASGITVEAGGVVAAALVGLGAWL